MCANKMESIVPSVSILLPVYNGAEYLRRAIDSLLGQSFTDFELIILNDGSTDSSQDIIDSYSDSRIVRVHHDNMGLHRTLNKGLSIAKGKYICRMDQDDIAAPDRLEMQISFLDSNPEVGLVGSTSWLAEIDGEVKRIVSYAFSDYEIRWFLLFDNPMIHSSVMFRRAVIALSGGYEEDKIYNYAEDYDLWSRMAQHTRIHNIDQPLVTRFDVPGGMSLSNLQKQQQQALKISDRNIHNYLGGTYPLSDIDTAILKSAWLRTDLPGDISPIYVLKRLPKLARTILLLFDNVYKVYSPEERNLAREWIASKYREAHQQSIMVLLRASFVAGLQPNKVQKFRIIIGLTPKVMYILLKKGLRLPRRMIGYLSKV